MKNQIFTKNKWKRGDKFNIQGPNKFRNLINKFIKKKNQKKKSKKLKMYKNNIILNNLKEKKNNEINDLEEKITNIAISRSLIEQ